MFEFLRLQSFSLLLAKLDTASEYYPEAKIQLDQLMNIIPDEIEIICIGDPCRTEWKTTRIVRLLQLAESKTIKTDGMTLLSRAGEFIKDTAPDISPKYYGLKSLKEIVLASGLFEVLVKNNEVGSSVILYKSKI